jgi:hypothetical protein
MFPKAPHRLLTAAALAFVAVGSAQAQQAAPAAKPKGNGLDGAAMCLVAGEYLVANGAGNAGIEASNAMWPLIMAVIPATEEERAQVIAKLRKVFSGLDARNGIIFAKAAYDGGCGDRDFQTKYVATYGSPELIAATDKQRGE